MFRDIEMQATPVQQDTGLLHVIDKLTEVIEIEKMQQSHGERSIIKIGDKEMPMDDVDRWLQTAKVKVEEFDQGKIQEFTATQMSTDIMQGLPQKSLEQSNFAELDLDISVRPDVEGQEGHREDNNSGGATSVQQAKIGDISRIALNKPDEIMRGLELQVSVDTLAIEKLDIAIKRAGDNKPSWVAELTSVRNGFFLKRIGLKREMHDMLRDARKVKAEKKELVEQLNKERAEIWGNPNTTKGDKMLWKINRATRMASVRATEADLESRLGMKIEELHVLEGEYQSNTPDKQDDYNAFKFMEPEWVGGKKGRSAIQNGVQAILNMDSTAGAEKAAGIISRNFTAGQAAAASVGDRVGAMDDRLSAVEGRAGVAATEFVDFTKDMAGGITFDPSGFTQDEQMLADGLALVGRNNMTVAEPTLVKVEAQARQAALRKAEKDFTSQ